MNRYTELKGLKDPMVVLALLVDKSLEVVFRATFPDEKKARLGLDKKIQIVVRHPECPGKTFAVLGNDVWDALEAAYQKAGE